MAAFILEKYGQRIGPQDQPGLRQHHRGLGDQRDHARPGAARGGAGEAGRTGQLAAQHGDVPGAVFMPGGIAVGQSEQGGGVLPGLRIDPLKHAFRHADLAEQKFAAQVPARVEQMPGLLAEEGDSKLRLRRVAAHRARCAVHARGHVHRDDALRRAQQIGDLGRDIARQPGAEHRVDHQLRAAHFLYAGGEGIGDPHRPAGLRQIARRHLAVAAIIAGAGQHQHAAGAVALQKRAGHGTPGGVHQRLHIAGGGIGAGHFGRT